MRAASGTAAATAPARRRHRHRRPSDHDASNRIAPRTQAPVIDASNETVIPGLIEIHTHLSEDYRRSARPRVSLVGHHHRPQSGDEHVRDDGVPRSRSSRARASVRGCSRPASRSTARAFIIQAAPRSSDTGQLPLELQHAKDFGYDFVKTYVRLPDLMQKRIIEAAHAMGMPVTSHELYPAVAFGADGVEHIRGTSRRGYSPKISRALAIVSATSSTC